MTAATPDLMANLADSLREIQRFPVIEVFGPTIQGEGPDAGRVVDFIRTGGCDYRCSWCDSMFSVEPAEVRAHAERLSAKEIVSRLIGLGSPARSVVISGGNPALLELGELVRQLHLSGRRVAVETQGSVWRDWLGEVDLLVVSPKPPSSGMTTEAHAEQTAKFLDQAAVALAPRDRALKVVVFDEADYLWARALRGNFGITRAAWPFYVSVGTPQRANPNKTPEAVILAHVLRGFSWLAARVAADEAMRDVVVLPQLHVLAFGTGRGV